MGYFVGGVQTLQETRAGIEAAHLLYSTWLGASARCTQAE